MAMEPLPVSSLSSGITDSGIASRARLTGRGEDNKEGADRSCPHGRKTPSGIYSRTRKGWRKSSFSGFMRTLPTSEKSSNLRHHDAGVTVLSIIDHSVIEGESQVEPE